MKPMYDIFKVEEEDEFVTIVFAFEDEIKSGDAGNVRSIPEKVHDALQDNGESCEDYVICTGLDESSVDTILKKFGYVRNEEIRDLKWS